MSNPPHVTALAAAGATLGLVHQILNHPELGKGARETIPPEVLNELLLRVKNAGKLIDQALEAYMEEQARLGKN